MSETISATDQSPRARSRYRRRWSAADKAHHLAAFQKRGVSIKAFCAETGIPPLELRVMRGPGSRSEHRTESRPIFIVTASREGKYFATSEQGAAQYAKMAVAAFGDAPYTIVSTSIPTKFLRAHPDVTVTVDRGIRSLRLPEELLPLLRPARVHTSTIIPE